MNASSLLHKKHSKVLDSELAECFNINLFSSIIICRELSKSLQKNSSVVFVSSTAPRNCLQKTGVYSATQAGIEAFAKVLAKELAPRTRVNVVAPGPTRTPLLISSISKGITAPVKVLEKNIPLRKIARPKDISNIVIF